MENSILKGVGFGLTSGVITTLGLLVGLAAGTNSVLAVLSGIFVIAVADAMSDALGMHVSEESQKKVSQDSILKSTISTFTAKLFVALTFVVPVLLLPLQTAVIASVFWGLLLISLFSYYIAKERKQSAIHTISEHLIVALAVVFLTHFIGAWAATLI